MSSSKTVLITGASSGIGKEFAFIFASNKYNLVLVARSKNRLEELTQYLKKKYSIKVNLVIQDLAMKNAAELIMNQLNQNNIVIDVLINNAGIGINGAFSEVNLHDSLNTININVLALTELTGLILPSMIGKNSGHILNIASTAAFQPGPYLAVYCASKAYVLSFSEALAYECRHFNVRISVLCPGYTQTDFARRAGMENINLVKQGGMCAKSVAHIAYESMLKNKTVIIPGFMNKCLAYLSRYVPRRVTNYIANYLLFDSNKTQQLPRL